jgi:hypothetical protein
MSVATPKYQRISKEVAKMSQAKPDSSLPDNLKAVAKMSQGPASAGPHRA